MATLTDHVYRSSEPVTEADVSPSNTVRSPKSLARTAGLLYLVVAVTATFAEYVRARIVESGDAAATAANIRDSATLWRAGFAVVLLEAMAFLLTAMALYLLLKHVNQMVAAVMVAFVTVSVAIQSLNLLNQYTALTIATGEKYSEVFGQAGSDALTLLFVDMWDNGGALIAQMFFGLWLLPLGYLVIRSGYFPNVLGALLIAGSFTYVVELFVGALAPDVGDSIGALASVVQAGSELPFLVWLLARGVRMPESARE